MRISSDYLKIVPGLASADHGAAADSDSVNMGLLHRAIAMIQFGNLTGSDFAVKAFAGATAGAKTTALAFKYRLSGAAAGAAGADGFSAQATAVAANGVTVSVTNDDNKLLLIEIESTLMPEDKPWLTIELPSTATILQGAIVFVAEPRFAGRTNPTVI